MHKFHSIILLVLLFTSTHVLAQQGFIKGSVFDSKTGESLPGVTIFLEETTIGTITDFDGNFNLSVNPGTYDLRISYISYETISMKNVNVNINQATLLGVIKMQEAAIQISGVTITAQRVRNTENSLLAMKIKSTNLMDGISSVSLKKTGDSDAAASVKRITGVSVVEGKYVFVRGLGDRYTKTILNGVDIPGLDPDRNTIQMDIFPTGILDNIIVYKTFTANLPADFTGGIIDITTKDFPEARERNIAISLAYNPQAHFNPDFLTYEGGATDFLGFDDGTRSIPAIDNIPHFSDVIGQPNSLEGIRYREILGKFNPTMAAHRKKNMMDFGISSSFGNQKTLKKYVVGYNVSISYKNSSEYFDDATYGRFGLFSDPEIYELDTLETQKGQFGTSKTLLSGMAGFTIKTNRSKLKLNLMHLQNGESVAGIFEIESSDQGANFSALQHNLAYSQRSLTNLLIEGQHSFPDSKWSIDWRLSPTLSNIEDPDVRVTRYERRGEGFRISTETGFPQRIWRNLNEKSITGIAHIKKEFTLYDRKGELQFGGGHTYKTRDYNIYSFALNIRNVPLTGNPDELFFDENLWPLNGTNGFHGTTFEAAFVPVNPNKYDAQTRNTSFYVMTDIEATSRLKAVIGLRTEHYLHQYTGQNQQGDKILNNATVLDEINLFPAVNFIYSVTEKQNVRVAVAQTIARPSSKELSFAEIFDPISGTTFIGSMHRDENLSTEEVYWDGNLRSTNIINLDARWELYLEKGEMVSVSTFYKNLKNPIEMVQYFTQKGSYQPRNVGNGDILGIETELRLNLSKIAPIFDKIKLSTNITYTKSRIELSKTEHESRIDNARQGETIEKYRHMAGQSPYIINTGLFYDGNDSGFWEKTSIGLFYNVQGETLELVGIADRPDIYTKPFHSLNITASKNFGKNKNLQASLKIDNILNSKKELIYKSHEATSMISKKINPGFKLSLKISYSFN